MRTAAVLAPLLAPAIAVAQPSLTPPAPPPLPATPATVDFTQPKPEEFKDPNTATMLSLGASVAGAGIVALGIWMRDGGDTPIMTVGALVSIFGPSAGEWWADGRASLTIGFGIRVGGVAVAALAFAHAVDAACIQSDCAAPLANRQSDPTLAIGAALVVAGMVYDVATAGGTAERHNSRFHLAPTAMVTPSGTAGGFALTGRF